MPTRPQAFVSMLLAFLCCSPVAGAAAHADEPRVLLFTRTTGYRHDSIIAGAQAIVKLGEHGAFGVDPTDDPSAFTADNLKNYRAIVFLSTTGDILNDAQQAAMETFIRAGGGFVGIHAAADTEYDWPWYGRLVGAYFKSHPAVQEATILVSDRVHPATGGAHLPARWTRTDEWYDYTANPRGKVHVLMNLNESSYGGGGGAAMEGGTLDHPIAWCHEFDGGRSFYTGLGHTAESFAEPLFLEHLKGGILWAAGLMPGDASGTVESCYEKIILDEHVTDPMELTVLPDGRVLFVERAGTIKIWKPDTRSTVTAGFVEVSTEIEDGLLGVTQDPAFAQNGWVYVYYSPAGKEAIQRLSRFTLTGDGIEPASEKIMLVVPTQRQECCHSGGSLAFGPPPDGCLYISTGDNVNPFASDGYAPIDGRPGRAPWDARATSSNTHDLRGKVLRIRPRADGGYDIPDGNLFPRDGSAGRPEIYAMGCRNPFRISIDRNGVLYWGDVGPDASEPKDGRGPAGHDEFNRTSQPGNFGWPLLIADNKPYHEYDFATGTSGPAFDPGAPVNDSTHNTGSRVLPPAQPAWVWYPYGVSTDFPWVGEGGRTAMAGPMYTYRAAVGSPFRFPASFDGALFIYEWTRNWIKVLRFDDHGEILCVEPFMSGTAFTRPMDLELGPDGCLYGIEWGTGFGGGNPDSTIFRIEHYRDGVRPPVARATASRTDGPVPLRVEFSSAGSKSRNAGSEIDIAWDFDGDGTTDSRERDAEFVYAKPGDFTARLTVTDRRRGLASTSIANVPIVAGNSAPILRFLWPPDGGVADIGDVVTYILDVKDPEREGIVSHRLLVQPLLGHDTHAHPMLQMRELSGEVLIRLDAPDQHAQGSPLPAGHGDGANLFTVISAAYTDAGTPGAPPLTGRTQVVLQPRRKQAEHYTSHSGIIIEKCDDPDGGLAACAFIEHGDWTSYAPVSLRNIDGFRFRVASAATGGTIEVRVGAVDGPLIAQAAVPGTDGWQKWITIDAAIQVPPQDDWSTTLFLLFQGDKGSLFNVNWIEFVGVGVGEAGREETGK